MGAETHMNGNIFTHLVTLFFIHVEATYNGLHNTHTTHTETRLMYIGTDATHFFMKQRKIQMSLRTTASNATGKNSRNHTFFTIVIHNSQKLLS